MKAMKYLLLLIITILFAGTLSGCTTRTDSDDQITVMTTIYPVYQFTKEITKGTVEVELILPPGIEPHSYELKTRKILEISNSDLLIYTGDFLEIWITKVVDILDKNDVTIIKAGEGVNLLHGNEGNEDEHIENVDPHVWLDPFNAMIMVDNILKGLLQIDPDNAAFYQSNAEDYKQELVDLDKKYIEVFQNVEYKTIIFGGHFSFGYLTDRYNLEYITPYHGFSPSAQPTTKQVIELINLLNSTGQKVIFYEELINPTLAQAISEETQAKMMPLNGAGTVSKADLDNDVTYLSIMNKNIEYLKEGLGYNGQSFTSK